MGARKTDDFLELFRDDAEHTDLIDQVKQIGFYTDCLGKCHWSEPDKVIDEELANSLVQIAGFLTKSEEVSVREMELWVQHLKPYWFGHKEHMEHALVQFDEALCRENIKKEEKMERFIMGDLFKSMR